MLSLEESRKILNVNGKKYTDEEIIKIREFLYHIAKLSIRTYNYIKNKTDETSNNLHTGID